MSPAALAEYIAVTDSFYGTECVGFILKSCSRVDIKATRGPDGLHRIQTRFDRVSEYQSPQNPGSPGVCHIRLTGWLQIFSKDVFYKQAASGEYEEVDIETLSFFCIER